MLNLLRKKGASIFIGDDEMIVQDITNTFIVVKYLEALHVLKKGEITNITPTTVAKYAFRKGKDAMINIRSTVPIYRKEVYEMRQQQ
jgi:sRNA-binding carbon storage regulator CsrA